MSGKSKHKPLFDMTQQELSLKLKATLAKVLKSQAGQNLPLVYRNDLCVRKNQFIHEYADGKKFLIQQNTANSEEVILRKF